MLHRQIVSARNGVHPENIPVCFTLGGRSFVMFRMKGRDMLLECSSEGRLELEKSCWSRCLPEELLNFASWASRLPGCEDRIRQSGTKGWLGRNVCAFQPYLLVCGDSSIWKIP